MVHCLEPRWEEEESFGMALFLKGVISGTATLFRWVFPCGGLSVPDDHYEKPMLLMKSTPISYCGANLQNLCNLRSGRNVLQNNSIISVLGTVLRHVVE